MQTRKMICEKCTEIGKKSRAMRVSQATCPDTGTNPISSPTSVIKTSSGQTARSIYISTRFNPTGIRRGESRGIHQTERKETMRRSKLKTCSISNSSTTPAQSNGMPSMNKSFRWVWWLMAEGQIVFPMPRSKTTGTCWR